MLINHTSTGALTHEGNELASDSTVDDPAAYRLGAPPTQRGLGKLSGDIIEQGGVRHEVVLVQFKQTEDANNQIAGKGGEFYLGLAKENAGTSDDAMVDVLTATVKSGFRFKLPIYAPNLTGGAVAAPVTRFFTGGGHFCVQWQDDYDTEHDPMIGHDVDVTKKTGRVRAITYRRLPTAQFPHIDPNNEATWVAVGDVVFA